MLVGVPFPICEVLLKLKVRPKRFRLDLVEARQEVLADMLVVVVERLQHENARNDEKDIGVTTFKELAKLFVLLSYSLYDS